MEIIEKTKLTKIGNSQGLRLTKSLVDKVEWGLNEEREVLLNEEGDIVIRKKRKPREGWEEQFIRAGSVEDHELLIPDFFKDEDLSDWEW